MQIIRSLPGFAVALAIGYAAGILMCVDAYHLGQSQAVGHGTTDASISCLSPRPAPEFDPVSAAPMAVHATHEVNGANAGCLAPSPEL